MIPFHWVENLDLARILEDDFQEMNRSFESHNWKSTMILAGGITEALLLEQLRKKQVKGVGLNRYGLGKLISLAEQHGIIPKELEHYHNALKELKDQRNLIHPENQLRSNITVDEQSAAESKVLTGKLIQYFANSSKYYIFREELVGDASFSQGDQKGYSEVDDPFLGLWRSIKISATGLGNKTISEQHVSPNSHFFFSEIPGRRYFHATIYVKEDERPETIMFQFHQRDWEHRVYWGRSPSEYGIENLGYGHFGIEGTYSRRPMEHVLKSNADNKISIDLEKLKVDTRKGIDGVSFTLASGDYLGDRSIYVSNVYLDNEE